MANISSEKLIYKCSKMDCSNCEYMENCLVETKEKSKSSKGKKFNKKSPKEAR